MSAALDRAGHQQTILGGDRPYWESQSSAEKKVAKAHSRTERLADLHKKRVRNACIPGRGHSPACRGCHAALRSRYCIVCH